MVNDIAARHADVGVTPQQINMNNYRLRLKIWAYRASRCMAWSNAKIEAAKLPTSEGYSDKPFEEKTNLAGA